MEEDQENKKVNWPLRIFIWMLPLIVLVIGFVIGQVWREHDKNTRPQSSQTKESTRVGSGAKEEVERLKSGKTEKNESEPVQKDEIVALDAEIPSMEYYSLQVGSFSDVQGAQKMLKKLKDMKYGGIAITEDSQKKVVAMAFFGHDQAVGMRAAMESEAIGAFPRKIQCSSVKVQINSGNQRLQSIVTGGISQFPSLLREICDLYYVFENNGFESKKLKETVLKQSNMLSDMHSQLVNMDVAQNDKVLHGKILSIVEHYQKYLDVMSQMKEMDRTQMWTSLLKLMEEYRELKSINS